MPSPCQMERWTPLMVARSWHRNELGVILTTQQENQSQIYPSPYISIPFMSIVKIARYSSLRMLSVMHKNISIESDPVLLEVAVANEHWVNESRKHQTMRPLKLLENGSPKELQEHILCIWCLILPSQLKDCATYTGSSRSVRSRESWE
ncbi:hypothetical protein NC653_038750 [Populus alba x Populus x berolinensis]|uniref:Uncharacterized protein n=1 Tax=Populus alba x Populus x berolinensis TaxID=444605 RepID=A0AAD6PTM1_9ROSI|nr:hypothetical protein NC653_038750 [Populus alba x Populus x berolinensis]